MRFGVFFRYAQVEYMGIEHNPIVRNLEVFDLVVLFGIDHVLLVGSKRFSQVHIIRVTAEAFGTVGGYFDSAFFYFFQNSAIGEDHSSIFG